MNEKNQIRTTVLRKSITRKINTGNYSNIDITCDIQQQVDWLEVPDLFKKSESLTKLLLMDFKKSQEQIMQEMFPGNHADIMENNDPAAKNSSF